MYKYSFETLHQLLLRMMSTDYPRYQNATELDILANLLSREQIVDYREIQWSAFSFDLQDDGLKKFIDKIISREETIRVLAFLRSNAQTTVFALDQFSPKRRPFEKECARLIHLNLEQSKRDEYHGAYLDWPRPNLERIAYGNPFQYTMSEEDKIMAKHMPSYPHYTGAFPPELVIHVAHEFASKFIVQAALFENTHDKANMPPMSQAAYINPMRYRLMQLADRYMYFDKEPAYQTLWAMAVIIKTNPRTTWCQTKFFEATVDYLALTRLGNTLKQSCAAMDEIINLSQPQIAFEEPVEKITATNSQKPIRPMVTNAKQIVDELADYLQHQASTQVDALQTPVDLGKFIYISQTINVNAPTEQLIANVEQLNIKQQ